ncbi:TDG/mug DNA glycosylase family protein [Clonorchis sinensis]|uniref:TDG/mug DNA glycosylase family protein n=1 Tax=Clonorchis sinensis TaxID=79923 RepID=G7YEE1_CLOSI|nr:TDG/mug DNA glycosylase family protein [Clonorchis sinensis]
MTAEVAGQANVVSATGAAAPQFITLAPGAPLKVMAVGPNGQLIQTTGLPQFMPAAPVGMTIGQQAAMQQSQPTAIAVAAAAAAAAQRRVATPQQQSQQQVQQTNGRAISTAPTAAFFSGAAVSSATIPLVQTAAGGEDLVSNPANGNPLGDENQSYLTTTYTPDLDIEMFFCRPVLIRTFRNVCDCFSLSYRHAIVLWSSNAFVRLTKGPTFLINLLTTQSTDAFYLSAVYQSSSAVHIFGRSGECWPVQSIDSDVTRMRCRFSVGLFLRTHKIRSPPAVTSCNATADSRRHFEFIHLTIITLIHSNRAFTALRVPCCDSLPRLFDVVLRRHVNGGLESSKPGPDREEAMWTTSPHSVNC